jgi:hypothetical protein
MTGQVFVNRWSKQAESGKCGGRKTYAERDPQAVALVRHWLRRGVVEVD